MAAILSPRKKKRKIENCIRNTEPAARSLRSETLLHYPLLEILGLRGSKLHVHFSVPPIPAIRATERKTMPTPQSYKSHTRWDPPFHFFVLPMLLLNFVFSIYSTIRHWPYDPRLHLWWIVMAVVLFVMAGTLRGAALRAQNRIIRLEERLRLARILPEVDRNRIGELTISQLIALRFASDEELTALTHKTLTQNLDQKAIKQNIVNWRADNDRV
jgi:hypothetical protein